MKNLIATLFILCYFVGSTLVCRADQPECVGDRHYGGVACCPNETTTTTLPPSECPPAACPDPQPCQPVVCTCDSTNTTTVVQVDRCPDVVFPIYAVCRERADGKARAGDTIFQGRPYKCPRKATPHRFLLPQVARS